MATSKAGKKQAKKVGRPPKSASARAVSTAADDGPIRKRVAAIDADLLALACAADIGSIAVKMRIASLQVQRWTLLSGDPTLNFREQGEASREAARWTHEFRQLSQRQADDLIRQLELRMREQEAAADHLEKL